MAAAPPILFLHIGWAIEYQGDPNDLPQGKFGYIQEGHTELGEALNFKSYKGKCYGYSPFHRELNVSLLGADAGAKAASGVLVVWTANNPDGSGRYIVGWYKDALVHSRLKRVRPNRARPDIIAEAKTADCFLVPVDERTFYIPSMQKGWPGISSAYYASVRMASKDIDTLLAYVEGQKSTGFYGGDGFKVEVPDDDDDIEDDPETRAKIEKAAVDVVTRHYEQEGWKVVSKEKENLGWDLNVTFGARLLTVEVKGRGGVGAVRISAKEYATMRDRKWIIGYRLAVVSYALSAAPSLTIFSFNPTMKAWMSDAGKTLSFSEQVSAIASFENFASSET